MIRAADVVGLVFVTLTGSVAWAQAPAPSAYTVKTEGTLAGFKETVTIVRDGSLERLERTLGDAAPSATLYDFENHRVYWIGRPGEGRCTWGRYRSARAPLGEDLVTGSADHLSNLTRGRSRKVAGSGEVGGRPARIERFVGGKRPRVEHEPWPTRVWVGEDGVLLKLEGQGPKGKPVTVFEVTELTLGKPAGAPLKAPSPCTETDAWMDETGLIHAHGEGTFEGKTEVEAELGSGTRSATATRTEGSPSRPGGAGALANLTEVTLRAEEQPHPGPCGKMLQLLGELKVDGPARISYEIGPSLDGLVFPGGQSDISWLPSRGSVMLVKEVKFQRSLRGTLRMQAKVLGTNGEDGPTLASAPVPFEVTCAGR